MATPATVAPQKIPVVALVGRVNVGKSTLFNRLIEQHKAIVSDVPGTTRTRNEGEVLWRGKRVLLLDTGGLEFGNEDVPLKDEIFAQTEGALRDADLVLFVTDAKTGVTVGDRALAKVLQRTVHVPVMLLANKSDKTSDELSLTAPEWYSLGFGAPEPVSATNGRNIGDFLDHLYDALGKGHRRPKKTEEKTPENIRIALIGKPNVGKSSLFNKLIGEEKVIVSPMPHTTREPHDTRVLYEYRVGKQKRVQSIIFVDTAGIRRKAQVAHGLESAGVSKSIETARTADMILLVIDGSEPLSSQDLQLGGYLRRHGKSVIILVNKWDLSEDNSDHKRNEVSRMVYSYFPHLDFAPIIFVSGKTGYRVHDIFPSILAAWRARHTTIAQAGLDSFLRLATREHRPSRGKGTRHPEIRGIRQLDVNPPVFELAVKYRTSIHPSYVQYIERKFREQFDFFAAPVIIKLTKLKR